MFVHGRIYSPMLLRGYSFTNEYSPHVVERVFVSYRRIVCPTSGEYFPRECSGTILSQTLQKEGRKTEKRASRGSKSRPQIQSRVSDQTGVIFIAFCHPTMCSMSFNVDHSYTFPERSFQRKPREMKTKRKAVHIANSLVYQLPA